MGKNKNLNSDLIKVSVSSMLTYFRSLSIESQENILKWAKSSKNPNATINTSNPSEWERNMKTIFSQLSPQEQAEVVIEASNILDDRKKAKRLHN